MLAGFEKVGEEKGVKRDLWSEWLIQLLPCNLACVSEHLLDEKNRDYDGAKMAWLRNFDAVSRADCEGPGDIDKAEPVEERPQIQPAS